MRGNDLRGDVEGDFNTDSMMDDHPRSEMTLKELSEAVEGIERRLLDELKRLEKLGAYNGVNLIVRGVNLRQLRQESELPYEHVPKVSGVFLDIEIRRDGSRS